MKGTTIMNEIAIRDAKLYQRTKVGPGLAASVRARFLARLEAQRTCLGSPREEPHLKGRAAVQRLPTASHQQPVAAPGAVER